MSKPHTPSPWRIERRETGTHKYCQRSIVLASGLEIAELHYSDSSYLGDPSADEQKAIQLANAKLIAASPDLLAACKMARRACEAEPGNENGAFSDDPLWQALNSAIQKAEST